MPQMSSKMWMDWIVVGQSFGLKFTMTDPKAASKAHGTTIAYVGNASKVCFTAYGVSQCVPPTDKSVSAFENMTAPKLWAQLPTGFALSPTHKTKQIAGITTVGYTFNFSSQSRGSAVKASGSLWLDPKTNRLVEDDMSVTAMGTTMNVSMVISHWNDPKLKVPPMPKG
jgi:hypothetical protein